MKNNKVLTIKALAYQYKGRPGVYLSLPENNEYGLPETTDPKESVAYLGTPDEFPDKDECIALAKRSEEEHIRMLKEEFGENPVVNFKPYTWLEDTELVEVYIDLEEDEIPD